MFVQKINVASAEPVEFVLVIKSHPVNPVFSAAIRGKGSGYRRTTMTARVAQIESKHQQRQTRKWLALQRGTKAPSLVFVFTTKVWQ